MHDKLDALRQKVAEADRRVARIEERLRLVDSELDAALKRLRQLGIEPREDLDRQLAETKEHAQRMQQAADAALKELDRALDESLTS